MLSEEQKVIDTENGTQVLTAYNRIPYALISAEIEGYAADTFHEFAEILGYYKIYKEGAKFDTEGTNGKYIPATLRYKLAASLVNKEARFMFSQAPSIQISSKSKGKELGQEIKDALSRYNEMVKAILTENNFEEALVKAAKDCFIGKRVAGLVNFNEEDGVTVTFIPSTQFIYETKTGNPNVLTKFVCFIVLKDSKELKSKRIFKKKYILEDDGFAYTEEMLYDGAGRLIEELMPYTATKLKEIPATIFVNDGLTGDEDGESEVANLEGFDSWYSKLANGDIDAERKNMNPVVYAIDMASSSTKNLSRSAGSFWDLVRDPTNDDASPQVGVLESSMSYSDSLSTTLDRIKMAGYDQVDVPNINIETMVGSITSGKALKAIYWPLIVRCGEKMKMWGPHLKDLIDIIIKGAMEYPNCITKYVSQPLVPTDYEITIEQNIPIQEDEAEEKQIDLAEVNAKTMSRKTYMKKWFDMSDVEVQAELEQIALERQILEDASFPGSTEEPYPNA